MTSNGAVIPVIDIGPLRAAGASGLADVAAEIRRAAEEVGFFYVANHGIDPALQRGAQAAAHAFFALPEAEKRRVAVNQRNRGFMAMGDCQLPGAATTDLKEVFFWGPEADDDDPDVLAGRPLVGANNWPAFMPDLREAIWPYYEAATACGANLLRAIAVSLDLEPDFFAARYRKPLGRGQLVYYPPHPVDPDVTNFGAAPHSDFGCITLLLQDHNGGLEIRHRDGTWVAAAPVPDTLVVNIGDLLARWSNGRFRSTLHRVVNRTPNRRVSIPVFYDPDSDAVVDPRDMGLGEGAAPLHPPVTAGDYIMSRNRISFAHYAGTDNDVLEETVSDTHPRASTGSA